MLMLKSQFLYDRFGKQAFGIHDDQGNTGVALTRSCFVSTMEALKCAMDIPFDKDNESNGLSMVGEITLIEMVERINELLGGSLDSDPYYIAHRDKILRDASAMSEQARVEALPSQPIRPYVVTGIEGIHEPALYLNIKDAVMLFNTVAYVLEYGERNPLPHRYLRSPETVWSVLFALMTHVKEGITGEQGFVADMVIRNLKPRYNDIMAEYIASLNTLSPAKEAPSIDEVPESIHAWVRATENTPSESNIGHDIMQEVTKPGSVMSEWVASLKEGGADTDVPMTASSEGELQVSPKDDLVTPDEAEASPSENESKASDKDATDKASQEQARSSVVKPDQLKVVPMPSAPKSSDPSRKGSEGEVTPQAAWK